MCGIRFQSFAGHPTTVTGGGTEDTAVSNRVGFSRHPPKNICTVSATPVATTKVEEEGGEEGGEGVSRPFLPAPPLPTRSVALHRGGRDVREEEEAWWGGLGGRAGRPPPPPLRVSEMEEVGALEGNAAARGGDTFAVGEMATEGGSTNAGGKIGDPCKAVKKEGLSARAESGGGALGSLATATEADGVEAVRAGGESSGVVGGGPLPRCSSCAREGREAGVRSKEGSSGGVMVGVGMVCVAAVPSTSSSFWSHFGRSRVASPSTVLARRGRVAVGPRRGDVVAIAERLGRVGRGRTAPAAAEEEAEERARGETGWVEKREWSGGTGGFRA